SGMFRPYHDRNARRRPAESSRVASRDDYPGVGASMPPPYCYDYPRPAVTVDMVVFTLDGETIKVLMIRRKSDPFAGHWALPGGFLDLDEPIEVAALRELR